LGRSNGFAVLALLAGWVGFLPAQAEPTAPAVPVSAATSAPAVPVSAATSAPTVPVSAATSAPANLPPVLLWVGDEAPLRSEQRHLEKLAKAFSTRSDPMTVEAAVGERATALGAWLSSTDPAARAAMPLGALLGGHRAAFVVWLAPPKDRVKQTPIGFGLLANDPPRTVFAITGMGPDDDSLAALKKVVKAALVKP
jgi:hypothetical protein